MSKILDAATCDDCNLTSQEVLEGKPCPGCVILARRPLDEYHAQENTLHGGVYKGAGMEPYDSGFGAWVR